MKRQYLWAPLIGLLTVANVALLFNQQHLRQRIQEVQTETASLTKELAERRAISPETLEEAQTRLVQAQAGIAELERRLTNASATLDGPPPATAVLQGSPSASQPAATQFSNPIAVRVESGVDDTAPPVQSMVLEPSFSHTPDGQLQHRSWGPEQVLGPPDTHQAGDIPTAWDPSSNQGTGEEWLRVNYDNNVEISHVSIRETYNPGAISRLAAVMPDGQEVVLWEGNEPPSKPPVDMTFSVPPGVQAQSVKVYLDRSRVPGWNEIDAVELIGRDGSRQWASSASASSSYAQPAGITQQ